MRYCTAWSLSVPGMKAIVITQYGDPSVLTMSDVQMPTPGPEDVIIDVAAAGVNRADVSQRQGNYPPPIGAPDWPGLEVSGVVSEVGASVTSVAVGDRVCALLSGGGYAERVVVDARHVLPVPESIDLIDAAGLIEAVCTAWSNIFMRANLTNGERLLVHGGSSGIGTIAIQMGKAFGATVATTAGSAAKLSACQTLGADLLINYREEDFAQRISEEMGSVDVILDLVGGGYLAKNIESLAPDGRIANIANLSGEIGALDFRAFAKKRATVFATTLRSQSADKKSAIISSVKEHVWPLVSSGAILPVIGARYPLVEAAEAHRLMESSAHIGKIVLVL